MDLESSSVNFILVNFTSRLEIRVDGRMMIGLSLAKKPQTDPELAKVLRELIAMLEAPNVEDRGLI